MAEMYLVRHGQASFGSSNYDQLSELGQQQAVWLGEYFAQREITFDRWVMGSQKRHMQTAQGIAQGMGLDWEQDVQAQIHPGFNEYDFYGLFAALGDEHAEIRNLAKGGSRDFYIGLKQVLKLWMNQQIGEREPESWNDFYSRVATALEHATAPAAKRVLVVSSGGPIGTAVGQLMHSPAEMGLELNLQIRNSSFSHCFFNQNTRRLATFNSIPHLDQPDRLKAVTYG